jgi:hypothetical protein
LQNAQSVSNTEAAYIIFPGKEEALIECCSAVVELKLHYCILVWDKGLRYSIGGGERLTYSTEMIVFAFSVYEKVMDLSASIIQLEPYQYRFCFCWVTGTLLASIWSTVRSWSSWPIL